MGTHSDRPDSEALNHGRNWSIEDDVSLINMWTSHGDIMTISRVLGRSKYAVLARLEKLRLITRISYVQYL